MTQLTIQIILLLLLAFFVGCIIGYLLHWLFAPEAETTQTTVRVAGAGAATAATGAPAAPSKKIPPRATQPEAKAKPTISTTPAKVAKPAKVPKSKSTGAKPAGSKAPASKVPAKPKRARVTGKPVRPSGLAAARGGKADNLQQISGVGAKLEKTLHGLGFFHFSQIAEWNADEVMWVDEHLRFKGRIARDEWIAQAKLLATGDLDKFARKQRSGGKRGR